MGLVSSLQFTLRIAMRYLGGSPQGNLARRSASRPLGYDDSYICPVCHHGQLRAMVLMDAFACDFCRHIFTSELGQQSIRLEDSAKQLQWKWTGQTWKPLHLQQKDLTIWTWLIGVAVVMLPAALVWLSYHTFPPSSNSVGSWFPLFWIALTFGTHLSIVLWLFLEYYQFPAYVALKIQVQRWQRQL